MWGHNRYGAEFLRINETVLELYSAAKDSDGVKACAAEYLAAAEEENDQRRVDAESGGQGYDTSVHHACPSPVFPPSPHAACSRVLMALGSVRMNRLCGRGRRARVQQLWVQVKKS